MLTILLSSPVISQAQEQESYTVAFWNVENFFDVDHDTLKDDISFTPRGDHHWTPRRFIDKRDKIYKTIVAMGYPAVIGLAEVENDLVLRSLCKGTPLRSHHYDFIHYDSPDRRGIDCALLYRTDLFHITESRPISLSDSSQAFFTRDILLVAGILDSFDTCYFLVNHWPSKKGGVRSNLRRLNTAQRLHQLLDSLHTAHPQALMLAMGDFNAAPDERSIRQGFKFDRNGRTTTGFINLMYQVPKGEGTYKYQDQWSCIDQIISNRELKVQVFRPDFLLIPDTRYQGEKPFRTYLGLLYQGGYSDHLPILVRIP